MTPVIDQIAQPLAKLDVEETFVYADASPPLIYRRKLDNNLTIEVIPTRSEKWRTPVGTVAKRYEPQRLVRRAYFPDASLVSVTTPPSAGVRPFIPLLFGGALVLLCLFTVLVLALRS